MKIPRSPPFFFFNDTATTEIYTLSLHDALPIWIQYLRTTITDEKRHEFGQIVEDTIRRIESRSEEHTSELQSLAYLVCRLLLEKKKPAAGFTSTTNVVITVSIRFDACIVRGSTK